MEKTPEGTTVKNDSQEKNLAGNQAVDAKPKKKSRIGCWVAIIIFLVFSG